MRPLVICPHCREVLEVGDDQAAEVVERPHASPFECIAHLRNKLEDTNERIYWIESDE